MSRTFRSRRGEESLKHAEILRNQRSISTSEKGNNVWKAEGPKQARQEETLLRDGHRSDKVSAGEANGGASGPREKVQGRLLKAEKCEYDIEDPQMITDWTTMYLKNLKGSRRHSVTLMKLDR